MTITIFNLDKHYILQSFLPIVSYFQFQLTKYIKHSRQSLTTFTNTSRLVKTTPLHAVFSTLFLAYLEMWSKMGHFLFNKSFQKIHKLLNFEQVTIQPKILESDSLREKWNGKEIHGAKFLKMQLSSSEEILENAVLFITRNLPKFKPEFFI